MFTCEHNRLACESGLIWFVCTNGAPSTAHNNNKEANMLSLFRPAPHIDRLPADKVDPFYKRMRWQVFFGIFFGYAGYYLVRKNFSLAMPYLIEQGFSRGDLGLALSGVSIAYGLSKFLLSLIHI